VLRAAYFDSWQTERILGAGLLPFGSEALMDAGPVCFDTRHRDANGDCPVVYWDHEWVGTEKEVGIMFSSSAKMFVSLTMVARSDVGFVIHIDGDDPLLLPRKRSLLMEFLAVDPAGAGGPGREYWTCWGVSPAAAEGSARNGGNDFG